jgi:hypothetical protein
MPFLRPLPHTSVTTDSNSTPVGGWAIGKRYKVERVAREGGLTPLKREALRLRECPVRLASFKALITPSGAGALPKNWEMARF